MLYDKKKLTELHFPARAYTIMQYIMEKIYYIKHILFKFPKHDLDRVGGVFFVLASHKIFFVVLDIK